MKKDEVYLARIVDSAQKISRTVARHSEETFAADENAVASVVLWLVQIGELAKRVSDESKNTIDLPWKDISGFRDVAVHDYYELDVSDVWKTAVHDISEVVKKIPPASTL